jgi:hypothetical protein
MSDWLATLLEPFYGIVDMALDNPAGVTMLASLLAGLIVALVALG